jgi:hypothetical protein
VRLGGGRLRPPCHQQRVVSAVCGAHRHASWSAVTHDIMFGPFVVYLPGCMRRATPEVLQKAAKALVVAGFTARKPSLVQAARNVYRRLHRSQAGTTSVPLNQGQCRSASVGSAPRALKDPAAA